MELYTIPFQKQLVIYKPRRHLAFVGNDALARYICDRNNTISTAHNEEIEKFLHSIGFDNPELECEEVTLGENLPLPTSVALLMTNRCNLRCIYCYANAGEEPEVSEIDWPTAQTAIDFVLMNASKSNTEVPSITFHGGGEPTCHWELMVRAVEYARERDIRTHLSMSTNGVWTEEQRHFICRHFSNISLSMDGMAEIQNHQRPQANGNKTFPAVMESIRAIEAAGIDYGIRMTVLENSVDNLPYSVQFICENTTAKAIQIEPTFTSKRGYYSDIKINFADVFSEKFMDAWRIGRSFGRQVYYSGARPWVISPIFCLAPLKALVVTADGRLVTCFELFSKKNHLVEQFTVGRIHDSRVEYNRQALTAFLKWQKQRKQECIDCFCYWHCSGDCATRRPGDRESSQGRCRTTQNITLSLLLTYIEEGKGVWQGLRDASNQIRTCYEPEFYG